MKKIAFISFLYLFNFLFSQKIEIKYFPDEKKYGGLENNKIVIPPKYDSIKIYKPTDKKYFHEFFQAYHNKYIDVYSVKGEIVYQKLRVINIQDHWYHENFQVIDSFNQTYFIDSLGNKMSKSEIKSNFSNETENTIYDDDGCSEILNYYSITSKDIIKKEIINYSIAKKNKNSNHISYEYFKAPKNSNFTKFVKNNKISISVCDYINQVIDHPSIEFKRKYKLSTSIDIPFNSFLVIVEKKNKFGIWNLKTKNLKLPIVYDEIQVYDRNLILTRKNLYTSYPNTGAEPKYKKLEPYIEYFARFETVDGKKGWVDRKGKEYFDE